MFFYISNIFLLILIFIIFCFYFYKNKNKLNEINDYKYFKKFVESNLYEKNLSDGNIYFSKYKINDNEIFIAEYFIPSSCLNGNLTGIYAQISATKETPNKFSSLGLYGVETAFLKEISMFKLVQSSSFPGIEEITKNLSLNNKFFKKYNFKGIKCFVDLKESDINTHNIKIIKYKFLLKNIQKIIDNCILFAKLNDFSFVILCNEYIETIYNFLSLKDFEDELKFDIYLEKMFLIYERLEIINKLMSKFNNYKENMETFSKKNLIELIYKNIKIHLVEIDGYIKDIKNI